MNLDNNFQSGWVGGFNIGATSLVDTSDSMGLSSLLTAADDVRFWAGGTYEARASAAFNVTRAGILSATGAIISGAITSTSGTIGGFTIGAATLTAGSGATALRLDTSTGYITMGTSGSTNTTIIGYTGVTCYDGSPSLIRAGLSIDTNGGVVRLTDSSGSPVIDLNYTSAGSITATGTIRANTAFNINGTTGYTGTFDPNAITSISVVGGIITAVS